MGAKQYLKESVEDLEDLLLDKYRVAGGIGQELDETVLQHGHEDLHGCHQRATLVWLLVPTQRTTQCQPELHLPSLRKPQPPRT